MARWFQAYTKSSKTMVRRDFKGNLDECPMWSFDEVQHSKQMEMIDCL